MKRITRGPRKHTISLSLELHIEVVSGRVCSSEAQEWVEQALAAYHEFCAGHVGIDAGALIKKPTIV